MILVKPNGGLANRMRVIHSALLLAKLTGNKKIKILWKKDTGLNAGFFDLFEPIDNLSVEEKLWKMTILFYGAKGLFRYHYFDDFRTTRYQFDISFFQKQGKNFLFNTCMEFLPVEGIANQYSVFKPIKAIQERIDSLRNSFTTDTIGVQIRRTDHQQAKEYSKTEDFISRMQSLAAAGDKVRFFLATDDPGVVETMKNIFGEKIIVQDDRDLSRNSLEGIRAAIVDMYALSATKFILGSCISSFGEVASYIGKSAFIPVNSKKNLNYDFREND